MTFRNNEFNFGVLPLLQRHGQSAVCRGASSHLSKLWYTQSATRRHITLLSAIRLGAHHGMSGTERAHDAVCLRVTMNDQVRTFIVL